MTYLEPPAVTRRLVTPVVSRLRAGGVATLTVAGRSGGRPRTVPVIPVELDGIGFLVSPFRRVRPGAQGGRRAAAQ